MYIARSDEEVNHERGRAERYTNNPYVVAFRLLASRLIWDLRLQSWRSRKELKKLRNRYEGKKAVIVCNGPSLRNTDLSLLNDVFTFGLNKISLIFDESSFRPSCIVAVNRYVIQQTKDFYSSTSIPLFLDKCSIRYVHPKRNIIYLHSTQEIKKFARDCSISIYQGHTVTFVAMQLAFHMGFQEVALVGCDHNFTTRGAPNEVVTSGKTDSNHFHEKYFSGGEKWQLPDLYQSEISYKMADSIYRAFGRQIVNATEGGRLDIFERIKLEKFLS